MGTGHPQLPEITVLRLTEARAEGLADVETRVRPLNVDDRPLARKTASVRKNLRSVGSVMHLASIWRAAPANTKDGKNFARVSEKGSVSKRL